MEAFLRDLHPALLAFIRVLIFVVPVLMLVPGLIWYERRLLSWFQDRIGPNRTGTITFSERFPIKFLAGRSVRTFGLLQPVADGIKLFLKEDVTPGRVDRTIYFIAPAIALFPAFALGGTLPWGPQEGIYGLLTPIADPEIGLLYILAISSLGVYGTVLAGYAANNKYSLMGGLRASAQLISYELAMSMALASVVLATGSLRLTELVAVQEQPLWGLVPYVQNWFIFTPFGFVAFIIFVICMVAETNRAPFDLPEAENELVGGYHTEYSSMKFAVFFMGEYAAMFIFAGVMATVFLGGYNFLPLNYDALATSIPAAAGFFNTLASLNYWLAPLGFLAKCAAGMTFYIWLRATLPRLRYDQLMFLGWKSLLPAAVANFIVVGLFIISQSIAAERTGDSLAATLAGWGAVIGASLILLVLYLNFQRAGREAIKARREQKAQLVDVEARRSVQLVDPTEAKEEPEPAR